MVSEIPMFDGKLPTSPHPHGMDGTFPPINVGLNGKIYENMAKSSVNGEYMGKSSLNGESFIGMFDYQRAQLVCPALHLPSFGALLSCGWRKVRALQVVRHLAISP